MPDLLRAFPGSYYIPQPTVYTPPTYTAVTRARQRGRIARSINACRSCRALAPNPPLSLPGPSPCLTAAVIDPLTRPARGLLTTMLRRAGLPVNAIYYAQGCPDHIEEQLAHVGPRWVILCGEEALSHYRPDLDIAQVLGQPIFHQARILWPVHSPAAILRVKYHGPPNLRALTNLRLAMEADLPPYSQICVTCGRPNSFHDGDGVGYCELHWGKGDKAYKKLTKARKKARQLPPDPGMLTA